MLGSKSHKSQCLVCGNSYAQLLDHIRKHHNYSLSRQQAELMGFYLCDCGGIVSSRKDIVKHMNRLKDKCIAWRRSQGDFYVSQESQSSRSISVGVTTRSQQRQASLASQNSTITDARPSPHQHSQSSRRITADGRPQVKAVRVIDEDSDVDATFNTAMEADASVDDLEDEYNHDSYTDESNESQIFMDNVGEPYRYSNRNRCTNPTASQGDHNLTDKFLQLANCPSVNKPLAPQWVSSFIKVVSRLCTQYVNDPQEVTLFHILALPKGGLVPGLIQAATGYKKARSTFEQYPYQQPQPQTSQVRSGNANKVQRVKQCVEQGRLSTASRMLSDTSSVQPLTESTINILNAKHPQGKGGPFDRWDGYAAGTMPLDDVPLQMTKKMKADTAAGVSGWTRALVLHAFKDRSFTEFINLLVKQVIQNKAPGMQMLCASRLIPLDKPDGGVRPIAVGEIFYRIIMKTIMKTYFYPQCLHPFQFGVGSPGGVEPIVCLLERFISGLEYPDFNCIISLDFSNAFNSLKRSSLATAVRTHLRALYKPVKWAYGKPSPLVATDGDTLQILESSDGVRQGDPLGPLLFSLGVKDVLEGLQEVVGDRGRVVAYLDDVFVIAKDNILDEIEDYFTAQDLNLQLNRSKCQAYDRNYLNTCGMQVLGTCIGPVQVRTDFLKSKIAGVVSKLDKLPSLPSQHALLLLTKCINQDLRHLQRTLYTEDMIDEWDVLDQKLWHVAKLLRGSPRNSPLDNTLLSLPTSLGGLGIGSHKDISPLAYQSMVEGSLQTLQPSLHPNDPSHPASLTQGQACKRLFEVQHQQLLQVLSPHQKCLLEDNASKIGRKWLTTIPFNRTLSLSDSEVAVALHYRLLTPGVNNVCSFCGLDNVVGHDDVCNSRPNRRLARHEHIKKVLVNFLRSVPCTTVTLEPQVIRGSLRTDFRISGPAATTGGQTEYDLTIISPTSMPVNGVIGTSETSLTDILNAAGSEKVTKYKDNTYSPFVPVVLSLGGAMNGSTLRVFQHWRTHVPLWDLCVRLISLGLIRSRSTNFSF